MHGLSSYDTKTPFSNSPYLRTQFEHAGKFFKLTTNMIFFRKRPLTFNVPANNPCKRIFRIGMVIDVGRVRSGRVFCTRSDPVINCWHLIHFSLAFSIF